MGEISHAGEILAAHPGIVCPVLRKWRRIGRHQGR
jgi:hypothetical protein